MGTRVAQFDALLSGYRDPNTGLLGSGYTAYFYAAGTTTPKDVWTAYDKTGGSVQTATLDATGSALIFGDGVYKVVVKNLSGATVDTFDGVKVQWPAKNVVTTSAATLTITTDMDVVLADPTSTNQTLTMPLASTCDHSIVIKRIAAGTNTISVLPSGSDALDGAVIYTMSTLNADVEWYSDGSNWYGKAAASTNADTLSGYSVGTGVNAIPLRGVDGYISGAVPAATESVSGISALATDAGTITGSSTTTNTTPANITALFSATGRRTLSANGYQKLPGGLIVQWGKVGIITTGATAAVPFPVGFSTVCYGVSLTAIRESTEQSNGFSSGQLSASGFTVYSNGALAGYVFWLAVGY